MQNNNDRGLTVFTIEDHDAAPNYGPRDYLPDPHYIPERERPDYSRDGCPIVARGDGWVDVMYYTVKVRIGE